MVHMKDMCPFIFTPIGDAFLQDQEIPITLPQKSQSFYRG